jgi:transglutaminase-like putative cysteine protease
MSARVSFSGDLDISRPSGSSSLSSLDAMFYLVPQDSGLQDTELVSIVPSSYDIDEDDTGNKFLKLNWPNLNMNKLDYGVSWDVDVSNLRYVVSSKGTFETPSSNHLVPYLTPTNLSYWNAFMKTKAESIVEGSDSTLEAVRRLTDWVSNTLNYDISCQQDSLSAEWVFQQRRGVCDEYTALFIALARSVGIPSRYVKGLVYSGSTWDFHAWAEVYIGSWIPVDPTYNEVGFVDSSHIKLAVTTEHDGASNSLSWRGYDSRVNFGDSDYLVEIQSFEEMQVLSLGIDEEYKAGPSEILDIEVSVDNLANSYVVASCSLNMPMDMAMLSNQEQSVLLDPHGSANITWRVSTPSDLESGFLHIMPLEVVCFPGSNKSSEIRIDPRNVSTLRASATITDLTVLNKSSAVTRLKNDGSKTLDEVNVSFCFEDSRRFCQNKTLTDFIPGEFTDVFFYDLSISEGSKVYAEIAYEESTSSALTAEIDDLVDPERVENDKENISEPQIRFEGFNEDNEYIYLILIVIIIVLAISITLAVSLKK